MHTTHYIDEKFYSSHLIANRYWNNLILEGGNGVALFFMISGFILSMPFARVHINNGDTKSLSLKKYYLRRLIRIEPPYIIVLIIFFIGNVWVARKYNFNELLPHFFASFFYLHTTVYDSFSKVLPIAWSLEVEVKFYILAPFLSLIFKIPSAYLRRTIFGGLIISSAIYNYQLLSNNFFSFICFFGCGMLLSDFYCSKKQFLSNSLGFVVGIVALLAYFFLPSVTAIPKFRYMPGFFVKLFLMAVLFYTTLTNVYLKRIFINKYFVIVGGMCYSIYLLHFAILSLFGSLLQRLEINLSNYLLLPFLYLFFALLILTISALYFRLFELPFMKLSRKSNQITTAP